MSDSDRRVGGCRLSWSKRPSEQPSGTRSQQVTNISGVCARNVYKLRAMSSSTRLLVLICLAVTGCGTAKKVAVTSFRVVDAPARYVRDRIDPPVTTTTTTVETTDVVNPGHPIAAPTPRPRVTATKRSGSSTASSPSRPSTSGTPRPAPSSATTFPTARPVPGRPGFVYSLDPNGGIVDVNGYKSGDKAKDPYTKQIFIVP